MTLFQNFFALFDEPNKKRMVESTTTKIFNFASEHEWLVSQEYMQREASMKLYSVFPYLVRLPKVMRGWCEGGFYKDVKDSLKNRYEFAFIETKNLEDYDGKNFVTKIPAIEKIMGIHVFAFIGEDQCDDEILILAGCISTNMDDNVVPNQKKANEKSKKLQNAIQKKFSSLSESEQMTLFESEAMKLQRAAATGTDGAK